MNKDNKMLIVILAVLTVSVLLTGGLVVYLMLTHEGGEMDDAADPTVTVEATVAVAVEPMGVGVAPSEPRIAFTSNRGDGWAIYVTTADVWSPQRVSRADQTTCSFPSWSPDGQRIAYLESDEGYDVWEAAADGTEHVRVTGVISGILPLPPTWSPNGTRLAFAAEGESAEGGSSESVVHVARTDGTGIEQSIPLPWVIADLIWSPTRDEWLLISRWTENTEANVYVLSGEEDEEQEGMTTILRGSQAAGWSPDGEAIAIGDSASNVILVTERDGEPLPIAQLNEMEPQKLAWSPDGAYIAVDSLTVLRQGEGHIFISALQIVTLETGEVNTVVENGEMWIWWLNWSPDGSRLLFTMGEHTDPTDTDPPHADLWVYDVASDELEQLTMGEGFNGMGVWSP